MNMTNKIAIGQICLFFTLLVIFLQFYCCLEVVKYLFYICSICVLTKNGNKGRHLYLCFQHCQWVDSLEVTWSHKNELHSGSRLITGTELHHYQGTLQVLIPTPVLWQINDSKECSYGNCCTGTSWLLWLWQCHIQWQFPWFPISNKEKRMLQFQ